MKKMLVLLIFLSSLYNCHGDSWNLGDDYVFVEGSIAKRCGHNKYKYLETLIVEQVLNFNYDEDFIIAYQIPDRDYLNFVREFKTKREIDSLDNLYTAMETIHYCYWIIQKKNTNIIGPMNKEKFEDKCKEMNIKIRMDKKYEKEFVK